MNNNEIKRRARLDEYGNLYVTRCCVYVDAYFNYEDEDQIMDNALY